LIVLVDNTQQFSAMYLLEFKDIYFAPYLKNSFSTKQEQT